jgi:hypothetical protein
MKNQVSKFKTATFYICLMLAIITGLSIETFTTLQLKSVAGPAASISETILVLTLTSVLLVFLNQKNFQQKKIVVK